MIQTGDPDSKNAPKGKMLGTGSPGYTIQPEFNKKFTHVKGAVAAARLGDQMNPGKESSGSQFYIVVGNTVTDESLTENEKMMYEKKKSEVINRFLRNKENANTLSELQELKAKNDVEKFNAALKNLETKLDTVIGKPDSFRYTDEQRKNYIRHGGTPHLDMDYTVFGEIVEGFDVIDKLSSIETDSQNRPIEDIRMKIIIDK
jgi:peptidylprolyl isomerase